MRDPVLEWDKGQPWGHTRGPGTDKVRTSGLLPSWSRSTHTGMLQQMIPRWRMRVFHSTHYQVTYEPYSSNWRIYPLTIYTICRRERNIVNCLEERHII